MLDSRHGEFLLRVVTGARGVVIGVLIIKGARPLSDEAKRRSSDHDDRNAEDYGKHR